MVDCPQNPRPPRLSLLRRVRLLPLLLLGLLCLFAPACFKTCERKRAHECEANLKSFFTELRTQQSYAGFSPLTVDKLHYIPDRGNRYAYFLDRGPLEPRTGPETPRLAGAAGIDIDMFKHKGSRPLTVDDLPPAVAKEVGVHGTCPSCNFVLACAGDTDNNPLDTPDTWSIATMDRVIEGVPVLSGETFHHVDDNETN